MKHDSRDDDLPASGLGDLIGNESDTLPDRRDHIPPHTKANDGVLLIAGNSRDVSRDLYASRNLHKVFERSTVTRVGRTEHASGMAVGFGPHDNAKVAHAAPRRFHRRGHSPARSDSWRSWLQPLRCGWRGWSR